MNSIWDARYVVVDIETTGSNANVDKIIEIACVVVQGGEITDVYSSLINPHRFIPPYIQKITGISNEMVFRAPEAENIIPKVYEVLSADPENTIFVAHNVTFDRSFVDVALASEGFPNLDIPNLCSLKLARRILPKNLKKNVGAMSDYFGVKVKNRHRALGDAEATALSLIDLCEFAETDHDVTTVEDLLTFQNKPIKNFRSAPPAYDRLEGKLQALPDKPGVYYFLDKKEKILYVGKAKSLRERVRSYFHAGDLASKKVSELVKKIWDLNWTETDSELSALITESREIKRLKPHYNALDKRYRRYPFIKLDSSSEYPKFSISRELDLSGSEYFGPFRSSFLAQKVLDIIEKEFKLVKCEHPNTAKPCLYSQIERCVAPCKEDVTKDDYFVELNRVRTFLTGISGGIITMLNEQMDRYAEELNFEAASVIRNQIFELKKIVAKNGDNATNVGGTNLLLLIPENDREKTIQVFMICQGLLAVQKTIGKKANLDATKAEIIKLYYSGEPRKSIFDIEDIDELRIVSSFLYKKRDDGKFIYVENLTKDEAIKQFEDTIKNTFIEDDFDFTQPMKYSDIFN